MKYVITGSIGHISKPIVEALVAAGHEVAVITSSANRVAEIESLGAKGNKGSVTDRAFLTKAFAGADAVYLMIPPIWTAKNWYEEQKEIADNYIAALKESGTNKVVQLSSVGADLRRGVGPVDGAGYLEEEIGKLDNVDALFLRPSYFFYNLFSQIDIIKHAGFITSAQPGSEKMVLVHTNDIADVAKDALLKLDFKGQSVHYIGSDELTWDEVATKLGEAIGKLDLKYVESTDEQARQGMEQAQLAPTIIDGYVQMGKALREGKMLADYWKNHPAQLGKVKIADFAKEFAAVYNA